MKVKNYSKVNVPKKKNVAMQEEYGYGGSLNINGCGDISGKGFGFGEGKNFSKNSQGFYYLSTTRHVTVGGDKRESD